MRSVRQRAAGRQAARQVRSVDALTCLRLRVSALFLEDAEKALQLPHVLHERIASELAPSILEHALDLLASPPELIAVHTSSTSCPLSDQDTGSHETSAAH